MNLVSLLISFSLLIVAMTVHEFAHGWTAYKLGDRTAFYSGRLTLNPIAHIDPVWTILIPLLLFISTKGQFVFGSAKPVPINYRAFKDPQKAIILVGLSGPLTNLVCAGLVSMILRVAPLGALMHYLLVNFIIINVVLGIFNLIPIPPLDGSRIVMGLLPQKLAIAYSSIEQYSFILLIVLLWTGALGAILWPMVEATLRILGAG